MAKFDIGELCAGLDELAAPGIVELEAFERECLEVISETNLEDEVKELSESIETDMGYGSNAETEDVMKMYLNDISRTRLLKPDEEIRYAKAIKNGGPDAKSARDMMINSNLRLVISVAKRYVGRGMQFSDLVGYGNIGLLKAVDKYDYEMGYKFSTYATWWIRQAISRALADQSRMIRLPVHMYEKVSKVKRMQKELAVELGREAKASEIANRLEMKKSEVDEIIMYAYDVKSLSTPVGDEDDSELGDFIEDTAFKSPEEQAISTMLRADLDEVLATLNPKEEEILRLRFGLDDNIQMTLEEVGKRFGVTRERIRQIESKALRKLKNPARAAKLIDYKAS